MRIACPGFVVLLGLATACGGSEDGGADAVSRGYGAEAAGAVPGGGDGRDAREGWARDPATPPPPPGCTRLPQLFAPDDVVVERSVSYGPERRHVADVFSPPGLGPYPLLIQVHGGAWITGSRRAFDDASRYYASRGIVAVAIDYSLSRLGEPAYPEAPQDVQCAIRVMRARASELHVDPKRVALRGGSAGATLVTLVGLAGPNAPFGEGCGTNGQPVDVQAVVDYFAPADFSTTGGLLDPAPFFLGALADDAARRDASPITHVRPGAPPIVIGHGDDDALVSISQSYALRDRLKASGNDVRMVVVAGAGHGFINTFDGDASRAVRCEEEALLERTLRPGK